MSSWPTMMASPQPLITASAMKMILKSTTKRLAALLRLAHLAARRAGARSGRFLPVHRPTLPPAAELMRVPAYMRRRRLEYWPIRMPIADVVG